MPTSGKRARASGAIQRDVRERILDAAERLFAERGYSATSIREITGGAACNVAAVNYYFGGKRNLYREVFRRRLRLMRETRIEGVRLVAGRSGGRAALESVLRAFSDAFARPLEERRAGHLHMRLMAREFLEPRLPAGALRREMIEPVRKVLASALRRSCPGLGAAAALACAQSVVAQLVHGFHVHRYLEDAAGSGNPSFEPILRHVVRFSAGGARACARRAPGRRSARPGAPA